MSKFSKYRKMNEGISQSIYEIVKNMLIKTKLCYCEN